MCSASRRTARYSSIVPYVAQRHLLPRKAPLREMLSMVAAMRERHYDLVIDLHGIPKTALLARATGGKQADRLPQGADPRAALLYALDASGRDAIRVQRPAEPAAAG